MENRIKEQQLYLFADGASPGWMSSNQLRLWLSTFAYIFFVLLFEVYFSNKELEKSQASTLRLKILKVSASFKVTTRRMRILTEKAGYDFLKRPDLIAIFLYPLCNLRYYYG